MKKITLLFLLILPVIKANAQKFVPVDSTVAILQEWIAVISGEKYKNHLSIRGITQELYTLNLKIINLSLEDYQKGKYQFAYEDMNEIKKIDNFPEAKRIKLFMLTMTQIKLNKRFKARKWYYVSKNKMTIASFDRLQKNIENQKLSYRIDNYKGVRGARIAALGICAGVLFIIGALGGE
ncbi:MAG: hypothetical protein ACT4ON_10465 [Bacteroidota bacterium]